MQEEKLQDTIEAPTEEKDAEAFFEADSGREDELNDFIKHMRTPRETVEAPGFEFDMDADPDVVDSGLSEDDREMLSHFDYTPEHRYTAEFLLIQMDKAIAFSLGMISGSPSERYRKRMVKPSGEDYEAEILAAILKKYQMRMSLEWMFVSAMVIAYAPMVDQAMKDRAENRRQEVENARRQYMESLKKNGAPTPSKRSDV